MTTYRLKCPECDGKTGCDCNLCNGTGIAYLTPSRPEPVNLLRAECPTCKGPMVQMPTTGCSMCLNHDCKTFVNAAGIVTRTVDRPDIRDLSDLEAAKKVGPGQVIVNTKLNRVRLTDDILRIAELESALASVPVKAEAGEADLEASPPGSIVLIATKHKGIIDCTGGSPVVRKVLGTLPLTVDGCVAGEGASVWLAYSNWRDGDGITSATVSVSLPDEGDRVADSWSTSEGPIPRLKQLLEATRVGKANAAKLYAEIAARKEGGANG